MLSLQELKSMNLKELLEELKKAKQNAMTIRIQCKTGHEKNSHKATASRRYVARIKTMISEVQREELSKDSKSEVKAKKSEEK